MAMGQRTRGSTTSRPRSVTRQIYQDFQPTTEWKQEEGRAVLVFNLPGFTKEQVGVQLTNLDQLRVRGIRPARANTWIRFDQSFPIPEDCSNSDIQAKFEDGILYVTLQKKEKNITEVGSQEKQAKPSPSIGPNRQRDEKDSQFPSPQVVPPPTASTSGGDVKSVEAPTKLKSETEMDKEADLKQTILTTQGKGQTEAKSMEALTKLKSPEHEDTNLGKASTPIVGDNIPTGAKNMEALSSEKALSSKPKAEKGGEDQRVVNSTTSEGSKNTENVVEKATAGEERGKTDHDDMEKPTAAEKSESALGKPLDQKQTEIGEKIGKEPKLTAENAIQKSVGKEKIDGSANSLDQKAAIEKYSNATKEGKPTKKAVDAGYTYGKYKQIVKDFITPRDEEERKLLVNMGVAALVIVALSAYVTYSYWSSEKPQKE